MTNDDKPIEIKDLNKTQLILLALLLSFVTSIATGIVTVSLMQQAPPQVTQTVNRVVQQTIEKVNPDFVPTKTQTIIVKEDELIIDAVKKTRTGFVDVYASKESETPLATLYMLGNGELVEATGLVFEEKEYFLGSEKVAATVVGTSPRGFTLFASEITMPQMTVTKDTSIAPGQTLVIVGQASVDKGIVQTITPKESKNEEGKVVASWNLFVLDITPRASRLGAPVVTIDGALAGFVTSAGILGIDAILAAPRI